MSSLRLEIDRSTRLDQGAPGGHNRWHPEIPPVASADPGDEITFEIRDSRDGTLTRGSRHEDLLAIPSLAHPLTGPLEVRGARPGEVLEVEVLAYETDDFGWTGIWPGSGFLGDLFPDPFLARWELDGGLARSEDVPGVAVPAGVFAGVIGVAPSRELFTRVHARESELATRGGEFDLPSAEAAAPPSAADGLRTFPPRENGGNLDVRDLVAGSRLLLPVHVPGALLSLGDLHFAQGDGEVCIAAIETGGTATVRVGLRTEGWRPAFPAWETPPRPGRAYFATTGIPLSDDGRNEQLDLNLATRRALIEMLGWLEHEHGLAPEPAYVLMSAAVELRVSELVDAPNALVSAAMPLDVFEG
ncbi:MAG: acetamidase/formamidase family protein [Thermoleophilaceae bacterium]|nr:acetamidase/formamidase family protein [Thermoleophilaceae bacterium]